MHWPDEIKAPTINKGYKIINCGDNYDMSEYAGNQQGGGHMHMQKIKITSPRPSTIPNIALCLQAGFVLRARYHDRHLTGTGVCTASLRAGCKCGPTQPSPFGA
jgi:hypothetical protein